MKPPEQVNLQRHKVDWWFSRARGNGLGVNGVTANGYGVSFQSDQCSKNDCGDGCTIPLIY